MKATTEKKPRGRPETREIKLDGTWQSLRLRGMQELSCGSITKEFYLIDDDVSVRSQTYGDFRCEFATLERDRFVVLFICNPR